MSLKGIYYQSGYQLLWGNSIREAGSTNVAREHLLLGATSEVLNNEKAW